MNKWECPRCGHSEWAYLCKHCWGWFNGKGGEGMIEFTICPVCGCKEWLVEEQPNKRYRCDHCNRYFELHYQDPTGPEGMAAGQGLQEKAPKTFEEAFDAIISELRDLMIRKQRDYGHDNITAFGEFGVLVRLNDKVARLRNLLGKGREPANESVEDSWKDVANYAIIALMLRRGIFTLPLSEDIQAS